MSEAGTVLVTGATGTVGGVLARLLAHNGVAVRAVSRRGLSPDPKAKGIDARAVDLRDRQAVAAALTGVQRVFLATPLEEDMAAVAARVVEQACRAGVRQVVRLSAFGAGGGATRLAAIHAQTEECLRGSGHCTWTCRCREAQGCARAAFPGCVCDPTPSCRTLSAISPTAFAVTAVFARPRAVAG